MASHGGDGHGHGHGHGHTHEDMLSVEEAYEQIMAYFAPLEAEEREITSALGQVLAENIRSPLDLPPLANSAMDGYAVRYEDFAGANGEHRTLEVIGHVPAGQVASRAVEPGTAIRIMTGAPVPDGADTIVPFEETDEVERKAKGLDSGQITIQQRPHRGQHVRPAAEDVATGDLVLQEGAPLRAAEVGVLASLGLQSVKVIRRPVVSIIATGDELLTPGEPLQPAKIYDSNSFSLAASVVQCGGIPRLLGIARDTVDEVHAKLDEAEDSDLLLTSAGVSKGDYDLVKDVLAERGEIGFWSVRMRPAKPLAFGLIRSAGDRRVPHMGLPGNPVSAMVAFEEFTRPAILKMLGRKQLSRPTVQAVLEGPIRNFDGRRVYARVQVRRENGGYFAIPTGAQGSNILTSMSKANGLALCPEDVPVKEAGETVTVKMVDWNEEVDI